MLNNDHHSSGNILDRGVVFLGEHCDKIQQLTWQLGLALAPLRIGYLDASHKDEKSIEISSLTTSAGGAIWHLPGAQRHWGIPLMAALNDILFVNGNHHSGTHQVLICNPEKTESVMRRREGVSNVILILLTDECSEVPTDFLHLPNAINAPRIHIQDLEGIANFLRKYFFDIPPAMLILAGGRSSRMGMDKALLNYHGVSQTEYMISIAAQLGMEAFVSVRDNSQTIPDGATAIPDVVANLGPLGGICSAHLHSPRRTWLIVACDMPLLDVKLMSELLSADAAMCDVVCFKSPGSNLPEPLLSLWKPAALRFAWHCIADGIRCPRKVISQCTSALLECSRPEQLANANTPEDLERLRRVLANP